jgi:hypothetical protein
MTLRSKLVRLASTLPKGSSERRDLISTLRTATDWDAPHFAEALAMLQPQAKGIVDYLNKNSKYHWKASGTGSPSTSLTFGEGASLRISTEAPRQEGGGWYSITVGVNGQKDEVTVEMSAPRWQSGGGRPRRTGYGLKWKDLGNPAKLFKSQLPGRR